MLRLSVIGKTLWIATLTTWAALTLAPTGLGAPAATPLFIAMLFSMMLAVSMLIRADGVWGDPHAHSVFGFLWASVALPWLSILPWMMAVGAAESALWIWLGHPWSLGLGCSCAALLASTALFGTWGDRDPLGWMLAAPWQAAPENVLRARLLDATNSLLATLLATGHSWEAPIVVVFSTQGRGLHARVVGPAPCPGFAIAIGARLGLVIPPKGFSHTLTIPTPSAHARLAARALGGQSPHKAPLRS